jgi:hypothetical protein
MIVGFVAAIHHDVMPGRRRRVKGHVVAPRCNSMLSFRHATTSNPIVPHSGARAIAEIAPQIRLDEA